MFPREWLSATPLTELTDRALNDLHQIIESCGRRRIRASSRLPLLFTLILFCFLSYVGAASAAACPPVPATPVTVDLSLPEPTVITDSPRAAISDISRQTGANPLAPGLLLNGLTVYHLETRHRIEVSQYTDRRDCFRPSRITAAVDVKRLDVYIAGELDPGSCQFGVTMEHEMKHVAVLNEGARRLKVEIETALKDESVFQPILSPDINIALERYSTALNTIIDDIRQSVSQEMLRKNRLLDTPEAYRADDARCR